MSYKKHGKCPRGHGFVPWRSKGKREGPRCSLCLATPIEHVFYEPDEFLQRRCMAAILQSVVRTNSTSSLDLKTMSAELVKDKPWRDGQLKVMRGIHKALMMAKFQLDHQVHFIRNEERWQGQLMITETFGRNVDWNPFVNLLIDAGILDVVIVLLKLRLPSISEEVDDYGDPWHAVYYYSLDIIGNIMLTTHRNNAKATTFVRKITKSDFIDAAMAFVDDTKHFIPMVIAIYILCHIYEEHPNVGLSLAKSSLLSKLGLYIHKDNSIHIMNRWMKIGIFNYEIEVMMENQDGLLPMKTDSALQVGEALEYTDHDLKMIGLQFACTLQQMSLQCVGYLSKDENVRGIVTKNHIVVKAICRWVHMPVLSPENRFLLEACLKMLSEMVHSADFAWKLLDDYGFMALLEHGVYYPDKDVVWHYFEVATRIGMHREQLLKRIVDNELIMRAAAIHMYSLETNCHIYATALMALAVDNSGVVNIIKYFGPKHFYYYPDYFFTRAPTLNIKMIDLETGCKKHGRSHFDKANKEFSKIRHIKLDEGKASKLKEEGNRCYNDGRFQDAIKLYSQAINVCPPTKKRLHKPKSAEDLPPWLCLPATLYSNRAQCHLNLGVYKSAVEDCDEAIARCLGATDPVVESSPNDVRIKAMFRRSKALFELGNYSRAVQDIGECQINQPSETFKAHLDKVLIRFRSAVGPDPVQRCDECRELSGTKLKRCARCMAMYCSKSCQESAWVSRHKALHELFKDVGETQNGGTRTCLSRLYDCTSCSSTVLF